MTAIIATLTITTTIAHITFGWYQLNDHSICCRCRRRFEFVLLLTIESIHLWHWLLFRTQIRLFQLREPLNVVTANIVVVIVETVELSSIKSFSSRGESRPRIEWTLLRNAHLLPHRILKTSSPILTAIVYSSLSSFSSSSYTRGLSYEQWNLLILASLTGWHTFARCRSITISVALCVSTGQFGSETVDSFDLTASFLGRVCWPRKNCSRWIAIAVVASELAGKRKIFRVEVVIVVVLWDSFRL